MTFGPNPAAEHLNAASDFDKTARVVSCQFAASRPLRGAAEHQGMSWRRWSSECIRSQPHFSGGRRAGIYRTWEIEFLAEQALVGRVRWPTVTQHYTIKSVYYT